VATVYDGTGAPGALQATVAWPLVAAGKSYRFRVLAANSVGEGPPSTEAVLPVRAPVAPLPPPAPRTSSKTRASLPALPNSANFSGFPGGGALAAIRWDPPADNGGAPLAGYTIAIDNGLGAFGAPLPANTPAIQEISVNRMATGNFYLYFRGEVSAIPVALPRRHRLRRGGLGSDRAA